MLGSRAAALLQLWLAMVVAWRAWIKVSSLPLLLPFAPPNQKSHPPSSISTTSWLSCSSSSPFLFSPSFLLLLGFYQDFLILVLVLVRIIVDLLACAMDLLLCFTWVNLYGLICWFLLCLWFASPLPPLPFILKQLWASSLLVLVGLCRWLCCRPSPEFEDFKFSPIGASFIYVLGSSLMSTGEASLP